MVRRIFLGVFVLFVALISIIFILLVTLIIFGTSTSSGVTLANGLAVDVSARSIYLGVESSGNKAIVRTMRSKVVIEPTQFTIDDEFSGPIPPGAKQVNVNIDGKKVNITADGLPVTP